MESIFVRHAKGESISGRRRMHFSKSFRAGTWSFYWVYLHLVPAYIHAFLATAIVLGNANLMASRGPSRHLLPPWLSNGLILSSPFLALIVIVPSVRAGEAWKRGDGVWEDILAQVKSNATTFAAEGTPLSSAEYQSTIQSLTALVASSMQPLLDIFNSRARITMSLMLTGAVFLLLVSSLCMIRSCPTSSELTSRSIAQSSWRRHHRLPLEAVQELANRSPRRTSRRSSRPICQQRWLRGYEISRRASSYRTEAVKDAGLEGGKRLDASAGRRERRKR